MSRIIDENSMPELRNILEGLTRPVRLLFFTQKNACPACIQQRQLLKQLSSLSEKIELRVYDFVSHREEVLDYAIDRIPATVVMGEEDYGIRFYGPTGGYEFSSLTEAILIASTGNSGLDPQLGALVKSIGQMVHLKVLVSLTCPYCMSMVQTANQFAFVNPNIRSEMVEVSHFPQLTQKYEVTGVPKTVINETQSFEGALPAAQVYIEILRAVSPEEYRRVEEAVQEMRGLRKERQVEEGRVYQVLIIGGGPAAMSAAIYAARKGLDTALIARDWGGQVAYTATVENYLGLPSVSGVDLVEGFRRHLEGYPVATALGKQVAQVRRKGDTFVVITEDQKRYRAASLVYCAGMEYSRLGVPQEERFIGKGIGFCATCDAPLYRGKRVAVVGGGNSALTAARDLMNFASEIHLIHRRKEFKADDTLKKEVQDAREVTIHTPMVVRRFLGSNKLTGVRLESVDGEERFDLNVDGVFLEIGLTPNTRPLEGLIELNDRGEVPVAKDQSTKIEGLFAAGDVNDVEEKQISIAVGQGALASLTAYKYLMANS